MSSEYTVRLERVFHGPLDLLLHLVREKEIEIREIEISAILEGYMGYVAAMEEIDLELAGDFLVMAATLMAIKSRSLLPREELDVAAALDPRDELIQRLIQYRRFKMAAEELERRRAEHALRAGRGQREASFAAEAEPSLDLGELGAYDLLATYSRLLRETAAHRPHVVVADPRPLRYYVERAVAHVRGAPATSLRRLIESFSDLPDREALVGSFCAVLELVRMGVVHVEQAEPREDIAIAFDAEAGEKLDHLLEAFEFEEGNGNGARRAGRAGLEAPLAPPTDPA